MLLSMLKNTNGYPNKLKTDLLIKNVNIFPIKVLEKNFKY